MKQTLIFLVLILMLCLIGCDTGWYVPNTKVPVSHNPLYTIQYMNPDVRADKAMTYYVLMPTVNMDNIMYRADVRGIVVNIATDKNTDKLSIKLYDDNGVLYCDYLRDKGIVPEWDATAAERQLHTIGYFRGHSGEPEHYLSFQSFLKYPPNEQFQPIPHM